ncbi:MAG: DNA internalization-related competence protein ComEC/Rec2 [Candidatus Margulisiibacteriota bacterium]
MSVSIAPILVTTPISLYNFNQFSVVAVLVNAIVLPWVEVMTVLGFISTALGAVFLPVAAILNSLLYLVLILLNEIVYTFSSLTGACLYFRQPNIVWLVGYYFVIIKYFNLKTSRPLDRWTFLKVAVVILFFFFIANIGFGQGKELRISVIDVGQGDSIFVESPSGKNMLIDGGPKYKKSDAGRKFVLPFLHSRGINKIDVLVLTHPHDDHVGGLPSVLKDLPVGLVLDSGQPHTSRTYLNFLKIIDSKNIPYKVARRGLSLDLGGGVKGNVLNPADPFIEESALNNNSIVIRLVYGKIAIMLTGDMEKEGEQRVLRYFSTGLRSDILKAGHHGSRTSSSIPFLEGVKPEAALISVGIKNKFHHPHPSTIKKFEELGIKIYRTDLNGTITVKTDGEKYSIER